MIEQLQRVQNTAAKIVVGASDHVTLILKMLYLLYLLPMSKQVEYKVILLTFQALNGLGPVYMIREKLTLYESSRSLCSSGQNRFHAKVISDIV